MCLDKGTYDAISLNPNDAAGCQTMYTRNISGLLAPGGVFIICSCNWTETELLAHFYDSKFDLSYRELKQRRRQRQRKRHLKTYLYFICATSRLFQLANFYKNGELSRNQIGRSGVQVKKENEKFTVVRSRSPQNLKCGHFTLLFCRGRQRNVPKCKTHAQSDCFCS